MDEIEKKFNSVSVVCERCKKDAVQYESDEYREGYCVFCHHWWTEVLIEDDREDNYVPVCPHSQHTIVFYGEKHLCDNKKCPSYECFCNGPVLIKRSEQERLQEEQCNK